MHFPLVSRAILVKTASSTARDPVFDTNTAWDATEAGVSL